MIVAEQLEANFLRPIELVKSTVRMFFDEFNEFNGKSFVSMSREEFLDEDFENYRLVLAVRLLAEEPGPGRVFLFTLCSFPDP